jgi:hypothetical protein
MNATVVAFPEDLVLEGCDDGSCMNACKSAK